MRTVIFDLDGTIADTSQDLINAANVCFRGLGMGDLLDVEADKRPAMMGGGRAMLRLGFERAGIAQSEEQIEQQYPLFLADYAENLARHTYLYPGTVAAIEGLRRDGYAVGICTNKPEAPAVDLLERLGVSALFGAIIGADTTAARKPDPTPLFEAIKRVHGDIKKTILVGDSPTDRDTARAASVKSLLVTFGPDGHNVANLAPDALLHSYDDLGPVVRQLIG